MAPLRKFYGSFDENVFLSTQYIRHHSSPLYTPEPDIVHEVLGHANQVADPATARLYQLVGATVRRVETEAALRLLSRAFCFTPFSDETPSRLATTTVNSGGAAPWSAEQ